MLETLRLLRRVGRAGVVALLAVVAVIGAPQADTTLGYDQLFSLKAIWDLFGARKYDQALTQLRPLVAQGNGEAEFILAEMTADGLGVPRDSDGALILYRQSAEAGYPLAQKKMGLLYFSAGQYDRAFATLLPLTREGFRGDVAIAVARMYHDGLGTSADIAKAECWARKAAEPFATSVKSGC